MPVSCAAFGCKSRYNLEARDKGITFHRFPKSNPILLDKWRLAMKRATSSGELWMPSRYQRLCSLHFEDKCFDTTGQTKRLRDDVIPSIFNFEQHDKPKQTTRRTIQKRHKSGNVAFNHSVTAQAPINSCASISQDHIYSMPDTETLKRKLQNSEDVGPQNACDLETTKEQEELVTETWALIFKDLTAKHLMTPQLTERLLSCKDLPLKLFRKPESEYSAQQRIFALTLHLYGPKAYEYLVQQLKLPLPCPSTLACWLRTIDDLPGINFSFLEDLLQKKKEKPELYTRVSVTMDTMSIQQQVSYDAQKKIMVGFTNFGQQAESNGIHEVASEVMVMDRLQDILTCNSPRLRDDKGPVNGKNLPYKINILQETKDYLLSLTTDGNEPLYESSRKRCIFGFLVNISSFLSLLPRLLLVQESVLLHRFSQDHIRLFFCSVQRAGGWNNKPTALNLKEVINRLLLRCKLKDGHLKNPLHKYRIRSSSSLEENIPLCFQENSPVPFEDTSIRLADHHYSSQALKLVLQNSDVYIAGWVVRKALCRISCDTCRNALVTEVEPKDFSKVYHLLHLKDNGRLFIPSQGAITTTLTAEWFFQHMVKVEDPKCAASQILLGHKVLSKIGNKDIFNLKEHILETESGIDNHHYQLVRVLASIYYVLRLPYFSKLAHLIKYKRHMKKILLKS